MTTRDSFRLSVVARGDLIVTRRTFDLLSDDVELLFSGGGPIVKPNDCRLGLREGAAITDEVGDVQLCASLICIRFQGKESLSPLFGQREWTVDMQLSSCG